MTEQDWWDILHADSTQLIFACDWFEERCLPTTPGLIYCRDHYKFPLWEKAGSWIEDHYTLSEHEHSALQSSDQFVYAWFFAGCHYFKPKARRLFRSAELLETIWKPLNGRRLDSVSEYRDYLTLREAMLGI